MGLTKTLKRVKLRGKSGVIVRELYLRDDISCFSPICNICISDELKGEKIPMLQKDATHYGLPCLDVVKNYLEIFEAPEIKGLILLQSVVSKIMQSSGRTGKRLVKICKDIRRGSIIFLNEIHKDTHVERNPSTSYEEWINQCCARSAEFYAEHLKGAAKIVLIAENTESLKSHIKHESVEVYTLQEYLLAFWKNELSVIQVFESLKLSISSGTVKDLSRSYDNYLPVDVLEAGIKAGRFFKGYLRVNKHNAYQEAFVSSSKAFTKESGDIFINGMIDRNRAVHGDEVAVEMLPKDQWKSRSMKLLDDSADSKTSEGADDSAFASLVLPTGRVVGVLERGWRNYIATLPEEEEDNASTAKSKERILVVPYDYRIPKIRIATKQVDKLRNRRIVVRIDSWEKDSQYPNGHLVQTLGDIGDLETEVQTLLIEHDVFNRDFPQNLVSELPVCTPENPWQLDAHELSQRTDLRAHLIFSIDPKGCEDVDDALSVRELFDGSFELGVHIADVTHFVKELSLVDLEARSRSTSIYLPDRRYDMLPHVLSGNLCSLLGNVDRYAVSVLWRLDKNCNVLDTWYGRTIINSKYKLCYEVAQDILNGASVEEVIADIPELQGLNKSVVQAKFSEVKDALFRLYTTANVIRNLRLGAGGLELSSVNMKFEIDRSLPSAVSDIKSAKELPIHKTVAECMIFANHWVAKKINQAFPQHSVLRRHPNPREVDLVELQKLAASKGFELDIHSNKDLAASLERAIDKRDPTINQILRILATQTMNQATYCCTDCYTSPELYHYGLGLDKYTHFTSPIRRYADILVHRLLLAAVRGEARSVALDPDEIEELCHHMNSKHKAAQDLEKDAQQLFLSFYFDELNSKEEPCTADAVIYALRANGVLVFVPKYGVKGAVCLCMKDGRVGVVCDEGGGAEWCDGRLSSDGDSLTVHGKGLVQMYRVFDHVTVNVKVKKSRSHQNKIVFDLVNNKPYTQDWEKIVKDKPDIFSLRPDLKVSKDAKKENPVKVATGSAPEREEFNMYLFLERIRKLTLRSNESDEENG